MSALAPYLTRKQAVIAQRQADFQAAPEKAVVKLKASSWVAGNTGARPVRMGELIFVTDSAPALAGHELGPTAPELLLGALASCLIHTYLIQAVLLDLPLDHVELDVRGDLDMTAVIGLPSAQLPQITNVVYVARIQSGASAADIARLHEAVDSTCPVLNTLRLPTVVTRAGE
jgi:organic hydroperoxide reductase OsmC/OhrA